MRILSAAAVCNVAAQVLRFRPVNELGQLFHAVVELMVARNRKGISQLIHQIDHVFTFGNRTNEIALNRVAAVHQSNMLILFFHGIFIGSQRREAKIILHTAVDIVGIEHHDTVAEAVIFRDDRSFRFRKSFYAFQLVFLNDLVQLHPRHQQCSSQQHTQHHQRDRLFVHKIPPHVFLLL